MLRATMDITPFFPELSGSSHEGYFEWKKSNSIKQAWGAWPGKDHPTTVAIKAAADSGSERDIKKARTLFLKSKPEDRRAALTMIGN